ncbi:unnamed protein product [Amoebophrya sp. A120]|nr:unnamed protein product [Amoebophrya sp. A120]|eukprot:GSA120T00000506001.1
MQGAAATSSKSVGFLTTKRGSFISCRGVWMARAGVIALLNLVPGGWTGELCLPVLGKKRAKKNQKQAVSSVWDEALMNGGGGTSLSALSRRKPAGRDHAADSGIKAKKQHQQRGRSNDKESAVPGGAQTKHDGSELPSAINTSGEDDTTMNFLPADDSLPASSLEKAATATAGTQQRPGEPGRRLSTNNGEQSEEAAPFTAVPGTTSTRQAEMKRDSAGGCSSFLGCSEDEEKDKEHQPGSQATQASQQVVAQQAAERDAQLQKQLQDEEAKIRAHYEQESNKLHSSYNKWQEEEKGREEERQREKAQYDQDLEAEKKKSEQYATRNRDLTTENQKLLGMLRHTQEAVDQAKGVKVKEQEIVALKKEQDAERTRFEARQQRDANIIQALQHDLQQLQPPPQQQQQHQQPAAGLFADAGLAWQQVAAMHLPGMDAGQGPPLQPPGDDVGRARRREWV